MVHEIGEEKKLILFGLIGHPVTQSPGQIVFNTLFQELEMDALYLSMDVRPEILSSIVDKLKRSFLGFNVTIPHKIDMLECVDELDQTADTASSINLAIARDGLLTGFNTDYTALKGSLSENFPDIRIENAVIFGSGGTSRTTISLLRSVYRTDTISVVSRNPEKAVLKFPEAMRDAIEIIPYGGVAKLREVDAVFNCSPAGMAGYSDTGFSLPHSLREMPAIVDFVYSPAETPLIRWAREHGTRVVPGDEIYARQAVDTFRIAFGRKVSLPRLKQLFAASAGGERGE